MAKEIATCFNVWLPAFQNVSQHVINSIMTIGSEPVAD